MLPSQESNTSIYGDHNSSYLEQPPEDRSPLRPAQIRNSCERSTASEQKPRAVQKLAHFEDFHTWKAKDAEKFERQRLQSGAIMADLEAKLDRLQTGVRERVHRHKRRSSSKQKPRGNPAPLFQHVEHRSVIDARQFEELKRIWKQRRQDLDKEQRTAAYVASVSQTQQSKPVGERPVQIHREELWKPDLGHAFRPEPAVIYPVRQRIVQSYQERQLNEESYPERQRIVESHPERQRTAGSYPERQLTAESYPERQLTAESYPERQLTAESYPERQRIAESHPERQRTAGSYPERQRIAESLPERAQPMLNLSPRPQTVDRALSPIRTIESPKMSPKHVPREFRQLVAELRDVSIQESQPPPASEPRARRIRSSSVQALRRSRPLSTAPPFLCGNSGSSKSFQVTGNASTLLATVQKNFPTLQSLVKEVLESRAEGRTLLQKLTEKMDRREEFLRTKLEENIAHYDRLDSLDVKKEKIGERIAELDKEHAMTQKKREDVRQMLPGATGRAKCNRMNEIRLMQVVFSV